MLLSIAVIYFLGIQSVASSNCPRLRCISRQVTSRDNLVRHVLLRCKLSTDSGSRSDLPAASPHGSPAPRAGWRAVLASPPLAPPAATDEPSTVAFIDGLCVTEYYLSELRPNASLEEEDASANAPSPIQLTFEQLSGFDAASNDAATSLPMVCNTSNTTTASSRPPFTSTSFSSSASSSSSSSVAWKQCGRRVPRLELVERLTPTRSAVCVLCTSISQPGDLVYHSISRSLLLRLVLGGSPSSPSSSSAHTSSSSSSSSYASFVSSLSVTLNLFLRGPYPPSSSAAATAASGQTAKGARSRVSAPLSDRSTEAKGRPALAECRWKCGWSKDCLRSRSLVCDGRNDCPNKVDEAWCPEKSRDKNAPKGYSVHAIKLSLPLVYSLVTVGCVLGVVFLLLCLFWAFCARSSTESFRQSCTRRHHRRQRHHSAHCTGDSGLRFGDPEKDADCPLCASCCRGALVAGQADAMRRSLSGHGPPILVEQPSTACSSSGVFEESNASSQSAPAACPNCSACRRAKQWLGATEFGLSDSSPAITASAADAVSNQNGGHRPAARAPFSPSWPAPNPPSSRSRPSLSDQTAPSRQRPAHHHRSSRSARRTPRPPAETAPLHSGASAPSHHQDWLLNLPASVRRCNDDDPRQTPLTASPTSPPVAPLGCGGGGGGSSGGESGRLLPPPNLNPFLDVPHLGVA